MHILIGAILAVALLYAWLVGHWFARVLVFLLLACVCGVAGAVVASNAPGTPPAGVVVFGLLGAGLGWPLASLPTYYWRRQLQLQQYLTY